MHLIKSKAFVRTYILVFYINENLLNNRKIYQTKNKKIKNAKF